MYYSVDRVAGGNAVLVGEDETLLKAPLAALPAGVKTGDVFAHDDSGAFTFSQEMTDARRAAVEQMLRTLLDGGDK